LKPFGSACGIVVPVAFLGFDGMFQYAEEIGEGQKLDGGKVNELAVLMFFIAGNVYEGGSVVAVAVFYGLRFAGWGDAIKRAG
jgi:hypothetical protein